MANGHHGHRRGLAPDGMPWTGSAGDVARQFMTPSERLRDASIAATGFFCLCCGLMPDTPLGCNGMVLFHLN